MADSFARVEIYMKVGTVGVTTRGAVVRMRDQITVHDGVITRLTGGTVVELIRDAYYCYQFNIAGEGRFHLAARCEGGVPDIECGAFESERAKQGAHGGRSFVFKVPASSM